MVSFIFESNACFILPAVPTVKPNSSRTGNTSLSLAIYAIKRGVGFPQVFNSIIRSISVNVVHKFWTESMMIYKN